MILNVVRIVPLLHPEINLASSLTSNPAVIKPGVEARPTPLFVTKTLSSSIIYELEYDGSYSVSCPNVVVDAEKCISPSWWQE